MDRRAKNELRKIGRQIQHRVNSKNLINQIKKLYKNGREDVRN